MYHDSIFSVFRRLSLWMIVLITVLYAPGAWATKYAFQVPKYTHVLGSDNVPEGTYEAYLDTDKQLSGWFETAEPLAANLTNLNILELTNDNTNAIVAYEFQDGAFIYTYYTPNSSTPDPRTNSGLILTSISTDQDGKLTKAELAIVTSAPFFSGEVFSDDINAIYVTSSGVLDFTVTSSIMEQVGVASLPTGVEAGSTDAIGNIKAFAARAHAECVAATDNTDATCTFTNKGAAYVAGSDGQINADELVVTVPGAPTDLQVTAGNAQATLTWTAPLNDGGAALSNYDYSLDDGATWTAFDPAITESSAAITGLSNGTTYSIKLRALNSAGAGLASAAVSVTPAVPVTVPDAPTGLQATAGNAQAILSWTAPLSNGGVALSNYEYSLNNGAWTAFAPVVTGSPATLSGLSNGTTYQIKLRALNSAGAGLASEMVSVTPAVPVTVPDAPTELHAGAGNAQATLTWTAPSNGGAALSNYDYSLDNGATWTAFTPAVTTSPATLSGLTNGTTYPIKLRAVNSVGAGLASAAVSVTPIAPVIITQPDPTPEPTPEPTPIIIADNDGDGVDDAIEANVPPPFAGGVPGDGNGDGIVDTAQKNVTSILFRNTDKPTVNPNAPKVFVTLVATEIVGPQNGAIITAVSQQDAPSNKPDSISMPLGLISFRAETTVGKAQLFSLWIDNSIPINGYFKQNTQGQWVNIASQIVAVGGKNRIDFVIKDGGEFDSDGEVNGIIVDPGAPGFFTEPSKPAPVLPELVKHTLSFSVEPTQAGKINADKRFSHGSRAVVRAIAHPGYAFVGWQENGRKVSDEAEYSFTVNGDRNLQALFSATPANELGINLGSRGKADLMAVDTVSGDVHYADINGQNLVEHGILGTLPQGWRLQGHGIVDGRSAVLLRHDVDETVFLADISHFTVNNVVALGALSQDVSLLLFADLNGDGHWDGLLLNTRSRELVAVLMNGYIPVKTVSLGILGATETVQLAADLNGDKQAAIILRDHDSGDFFLLDNLATGGKRTLLGRLSLDWQLLGQGRFNRDDQADLLLRHSVTGLVRVLYMNDATRQSGSTEIPVSLDWQLTSLGDFTGDGLTDLIWQHDSNRQLAITTTHLNDLSDFVPLFELPANLELIAK